MRKGQTASPETRARQSESHKRLWGVPGFREKWHAARWENPDRDDSNLGRPLIDLTGRVFGGLTVIERDTSRTEKDRTYWTCRCECGKTISVLAGSLRKGQTSCGCRNRIDIRGQVFGRLLVLDLQPQQRHTKKGGGHTPTLFWLCHCKCGREKWISGAALRNGATQSCGCLVLEPRPRGADSPMWKGGRHISAKGYIVALDWSTGKKRMIPLHRLVMERFLGRVLLPSESVHHINGVRTDNRIENLELWSRTQPSGQRVTDKVDFAVEILLSYMPSVLRGVLGP
jgi:hypothetical protein